MIPFRTDHPNLSPFKKGTSPRVDCRDAFSATSQTTLLSPSKDVLSRRNERFEDARKSTQDIMLHGAPLPLSWVLVTDNVIPDYAVPFSAAYGGPQFVARAFLEGQYCIGAAGTGLPLGALIDFAGRQVTVKRYEVLCFATEMRWSITQGLENLQQGSYIVSDGAKRSRKSNSFRTSQKEITASLLFDSDILRVIPDNGVRCAASTTERSRDYSTDKHHSTSPLSPISRDVIEDICSSAAIEVDTVKLTRQPSQRSPFVIPSRHEYLAGDSLRNERSLDIETAQTPRSQIKQSSELFPAIGQADNRVRRLSSSAYARTLTTQDSTNFQQPESLRTRSLIGSPRAETTRERQNDDGRFHDAIAAPVPRASYIPPTNDLLFSQPFDDHTHSTVPIIDSPKMLTRPVDGVSRHDQRDVKSEFYPGGFTHARSPSVLRVSSPLTGRLGHAGTGAAAASRVSEHDLVGRPLEASPTWVGASSHERNPYTRPFSRNSSVQRPQILTTSSPRQTERSLAYVEKEVGDREFMSERAAHRIHTVEQPADSRNIQIATMAADTGLHRLGSSAEPLVRSLYPSKDDKLVHLRPLEVNVDINVDAQRSRPGSNVAFSRKPESPISTTQVISSTLATAGAVAAVASSYSERSPTVSVSSRPLANTDINKTAAARTADHFPLMRKISIQERPDDRHFSEAARTPGPAVLQSARPTTEHGELDRLATEKARMCIAVEDSQASDVRGPGRVSSPLVPRLSTPALGAPQFAISRGESGSSGRGASPTQGTQGYGIHGTVAQFSHSDMIQTRPSREEGVSIGVSDTRFTSGKSSRPREGTLGRSSSLLDNTPSRASDPVLARASLHLQADVKARAPESNSVHSPFDAKDRLGNVQRADAERVSLSWDEKTHTTPSNMQQRYEVPLSKYLGPEGDVYASVVTSREGKGGFKQEGPATSRGAIEESKSTRVAQEFKGRENAKLASSKNGSSVVSGVLAAAAVAAVTLEAISDYRQQHSERAEVKLDERKEAIHGRGFPTSRESAKVTEDRETMLTGKDVSENLRVQQTVVADLPSSLEPKTGQTPVPIVLDETESRRSRPTDIQISRTSAIEDRKPITRTDSRPGVSAADVYTNLRIDKSTDSATLAKIGVQTRKTLPSEGSALEIVTSEQAREVSGLAQTDQRSRKEVDVHNEVTYATQSTSSHERKMDAAIDDSGQYGSPDMVAITRTRKDHSSQIPAAAVLTTTSGNMAKSTGSTRTSDGQRTEIVTLRSGVDTGGNPFHSASTSSIQNDQLIRSLESTTAGTYQTAPLKTTTSTTFTNISSETLVVDAELPTKEITLVPGQPIPALIALGKRESAIIDHTELSAQIEKGATMTTKTSNDSSANLKQVAHHNDHAERVDGVRVRTTIDLQSRTSVIHDEDTVAIQRASSSIEGEATSSKFSETFTENGLPDRSARVAINDRKLVGISGVRESRAVSVDDTDAGNMTTIVRVTSNGTNSASLEAKLCEKTGGILQRASSMDLSGEAARGPSRSAFNASSQDRKANLVHGIGSLDSVGAEPTPCGSRGFASDSASVSLTLDTFSSPARPASPPCVTLVSKTDITTVKCHPEELSVVDTRGTVLDVRDVGGHREDVERSSKVEKTTNGYASEPGDIVAARTSAGTLRSSTHATEKAIALGCVIGALALTDSAIERVARDGPHTEQFEAREETERIHAEKDVEFHLERSVTTSVPDRRVEATVDSAAAASSRPENSWIPLTGGPVRAVSSEERSLELGSNVEMTEQRSSVASVDVCDSASSVLAESCARTKNVLDARRDIQGSTLIVSSERRSEGMEHDQIEETRASVIKSSVGSFERSDLLHQESLGGSADIKRTTDTNMNSSVSYLVPSDCRRVEEVTDSRDIIMCQPEPNHSLRLAAAEESKVEEKRTSDARVDALSVRQGFAFNQQDNISTMEDTSRLVTSQVVSTATTETALTNVACTPVLTPENGSSNAYRRLVSPKTSEAEANVDVSVSGAVSVSSGPRPPLAASLACVSASKDHWSTADTAQIIGNGVVAAGAVVAIAASARSSKESEHEVEVEDEVVAWGRNISLSTTGSHDQYSVSSRASGLVLHSAGDAPQTVLRASHVDYSESQEGTCGAPGDQVHGTIAIEEVGVEGVEAVSVRKDNLRSSFSYVSSPSSPVTPDPRGEAYSIDTAEKQCSREQFGGQASTSQEKRTQTRMQVQTQMAQVPTPSGASKDSIEWHMSTWIPDVDAEEPPPSYEDAAVGSLVKASDVQLGADGPAFSGPHSQQYRGDEKSSAVVDTAAASVFVRRSDVGTSAVEQHFGACQEILTERVDPTSTTGKASFTKYADDTSESLATQRDIENLSTSYSVSTLDTSIASTENLAADVRKSQIRHKEYEGHMATQYDEHGTVFMADSNNTSAMTITSKAAQDIEHSAVVVVDADKSRETTTTSNVHAAVTMADTRRESKTIDAVGSKAEIQTQSRVLDSLRRQSYNGGVQVRATSTSGEDDHVDVEVGTATVLSSLPARDGRRSLSLDVTDEHLEMSHATDQFVDAVSTLHSLQAHSDTYVATTDVAASGVQTSSGAAVQLDVDASTSASITRVQASEQVSSTSGSTFDVSEDQQTHLEHLDVAIQRQEQKRTSSIASSQVARETVKTTAGDSKAEKRTQNVVSVVDSTCEQLSSDAVRATTTRSGKVDDMDVVAGVSSAAALSSLEVHSVQQSRALDHTDEHLETRATKQLVEHIEQEQEQEQGDSEAWTTDVSSRISSQVHNSASVTTADIATSSTQTSSGVVQTTKDLDESASVIETFSGVSSTSRSTLDVLDDQQTHLDAVVQRQEQKRIASSASSHVAASSICERDFDEKEIADFGEEEDRCASELVSEIAASTSSTLIVSEQRVGTVVEANETETRACVTEETKQAREERTAGVSLEVSSQELDVRATRTDITTSNSSDIQMTKEFDVSASVTEVQSSEVEKVEDVLSTSTSALDVREDQHAHADHLAVDVRRQGQNKTTSIKSTAVASSRERGEEEYVCYGEEEDRCGPSAATAVKVNEMASRARATEQTEQEQEEWTMGVSTQRSSQECDDARATTTEIATSGAQTSSGAVQTTKTSDVSASVTTSALDVRSDQHAHADHLGLDMRRQEQSKTISIKSTAVASSRERGEEEYVCYGEEEDGWGPNVATVVKVDETASRARATEQTKQELEEEWTVEASTQRSSQECDDARTTMEIATSGAQTSSGAVETTKTLDMSASITGVQTSHVEKVEDVSCEFDVHDDQQTHVELDVTERRQEETQTASSTSSKTVVSSSCELSVEEKESVDFREEEDRSGFESEIAASSATTQTFSDSEEKRSIETVVELVAKDTASRTRAAEQTEQEQEWTVGATATEIAASRIHTSSSGAVQTTKELDSASITRVQSSEVEAIENFSSTSASASALDINGDSQAHAELDVVVRKQEQEQTTSIASSEAVVSSSCEQSVNEKRCLGYSKEEDCGESDRRSVVVGSFESEVAATMSSTLVVSGEQQTQGTVVEAEAIETASRTSTTGQTTTEATKTILSSDSEASAEMTSRLRERGVDHASGSHILEGTTLAAGAAAFAWAALETKESGTLPEEGNTIRTTTKTQLRALADMGRSESAADESLVTTKQRRARSVSHFDEDLSEFSEEGIHINGNGRDRSGSQDSADGVTRERSTAVVTTQRARSVSLSGGDRPRGRQSPVSRRTIMGGETVRDLENMAGSYSATVVQDLEGTLITSNQCNSDTQEVTFCHEKTDEELDVTSTFESDSTTYMTKSGVRHRVPSLDYVEESDKRRVVDLHGVAECGGVSRSQSRSTNSRSMEYWQSLEAGEFEHSRTVVKDGSEIESESVEEQTLVKMTRGDATRLASRRTWSLAQGWGVLGFKRAVSLEHAMAHVIDHRMLVDKDEEGYGPGAVVRPGSRAAGTDAVNRSVVVLMARAYGQPFDEDELANRILDCIVSLDPGLVDAGEVPQVQEIGLLYVVGRKTRNTVHALEEVLEAVKVILLQECAIEARHVVINELEMGYWITVTLQIGAEFWTSVQAEIEQIEDVGRWEELDDSELPPAEEVGMEYAATGEYEEHEQLELEGGVTVYDEGAEVGVEMEVEEVEEEAEEAVSEDAHEVVEVVA